MFILSEAEDSDTEKDKTDDTTKNKIKAKPKKPGK